MRIQIINTYDGKKTDSAQHICFIHLRSMIFNFIHAYCGQRREV